jgi:hypothetical protein
MGLGMVVFFVGLVVSAMLSAAAVLVIFERFVIC